VPTVLLVRHGRTTANSGGVLAGWTPGIGLDDTGWAQARSLATRLAVVPVCAIWSSPLQRCLETAAELAAVPGPKATPRSEVRVDDRLGECRYGDWTGRTLKERAAVFFKYYQLLEARQGEIAGLIHEEMGKDPGDARAEVYNTLTASAPYARGHVDCKEIVQDRAVAKAVPIVEVSHPMAHITHEAAIGSVDSKQLQTLMSRGLTEDEATDLIIEGLLS